MTSCCVLCRSTVRLNGYILLTPFPSSSVNTTRFGGADGTTRAVNDQAETTGNIRHLGHLFDCLVRLVLQKEITGKSSDLLSFGKWKKQTCVHTTGALRANVPLRALWSQSCISAVKKKEAEQMGITIFEEMDSFS